MYEPLLIEGLFALGCGSRNDTLALINKVVSQMSLEAEIKGITVKSVNEAKELRFLEFGGRHT